VQTVFGTRSFEGKLNSSAPDTKLKQVQGGKWVTVWPARYRPPAATFAAQ